MLTAAQYSQVNCCIPKIMFSFWFHSSHILLHGAWRAVCCYRMPLVLPRTIWTHRVRQALTECKNKRSHLCFLSLWHQQGKGLPATVPAVKSTWILWCLKCYQAEHNISLHSSAPGNYRSINLLVCARWSSHLHAANKQGGRAWWTCTGMLLGEGGHFQCKPARTKNSAPQFWCYHFMMTTFPDPVSILLLIPLLQVVISNVSVLAELLQSH